MTLTDDLDGPIEVKVDRLLAEHRDPGLGGLPQVAAWVSVDDAIKHRIDMVADQMPRPEMLWPRHYGDSATCLARAMVDVVDQCEVDVGMGRQVLCVHATDEARTDQSESVHVRLDRFRRREDGHDPAAVVGVGRRGGLHELDTDEAVDAGRDGQFALECWWCRRVAHATGREVRVEVGERFQKPLGVTRARVG